MQEKEFVIVPPSPVDTSNFPLITDLQFLEPFGSESLNRKFFGITPPGIYRGFKAQLPGGMVLRIGRVGEAGTAIVELNNEHCLTIQQRHPVDLQVKAGFSGFVVLEGFYKFGVPTMQVDTASAIEAARILLVTQPEIRPDHVTLYALNVPAGATALTEAMLSTEHRQDVELAGGSAVDGGTFDGTALGQRQIQVRRGPEAKRKDFHLLPGELGYTTDEERVAIGGNGRAGGLLLDASKWVEAAGKTALPQGKYLFQQGGVLTLPDVGFEPGETVYVRSPVALTPAGSQMLVKTTGDQDKIATSGGPVSEIRMQLDEEAAFVRTGTGWMCLAGGKDGMPVGTIVIFAKRPIPAGFLELNGASFNQAMYPTLFEHLGTDKLPNFADRYPKMVGSEIELLERRGWVVPSHTHEVTGGAHSHSRGTMDISGIIGRLADAGNRTWPLGCSELSGAFYANDNTGYDAGTIMTSQKPNGGAINVNFVASRSWSGRTSAESHSHDVSKFGNGDHVDPNHIGVIYAIKAAGARINGGLLDEAGILTELAALRRDMAELEGGVPLFTTFWCDDRNNIPAGYAPADGQLLSRELFPTVAQKLQGMASRTISDATWLADPLKRGKYTLGDGSTNFRLPDLNGKQPGSIGALYLRGDGLNSAGADGLIQGDATREISGELRTRPAPNNDAVGCVTEALGAFHSPNKGSGSPGASGLLTGGVGVSDTVKFSSSKVVPTANENRPVSVTGCYIIKLFSANNMIGQANAAQLATEVSRLQSEKASAADGVPLLTVQWWDDRQSLPPGYIPADGQLLTRDMFPTAVAQLKASPSRVISDAAWLADSLKRGKYTLGDGSTNFRLPDLNGKQSGSIGALYLRGDGLNSAGADGLIQGDAIRNIEGVLANVYTGDPNSFGGALVYSGFGFTSLAGGAVNVQFRNVSLNASKVVPTAPENRPVSVTGCYIIKLFSSANVVGEGDASQLLAEIAKLQAEKASLDQLYLENPVGIPQDWPLEVPPDGWICCMGQAFDKQQCPRLAKAYPSGVLPDLRGEFIRGWDNGRGVDTGRQLLSAQAATQLPSVYTYASSPTTGALVTPPVSSFGGAFPTDKMATDFEGATTTPSGQYFSTQQGLTPTGSGGLAMFRVRSRSVAYNKIVRKA